MKEFKTESKKILDMMINSVYTNKDIFLRELISNSSDALDKLEFESLTDKKLKYDKKDLAIHINVDRDKRLLTISDNGIGMDKDELDKNLGVVARSGTLDYKEKLDKKSDLIGMFGVGFYSAFMVAEKIEVISKKRGSKAYKWTSHGLKGYDIKESDAKEDGTKVILTIKKDEEFNYDKYLDDNNLKNLIVKYSNHIRYPIYLNDKEEHINEMVPIWKKAKKSIKEEEYASFYKERFRRFDDPELVIHGKAEGRYEFDYLLYIPSKMPVDFYSKDYDLGLALYARGVMIMDRCKDLLPDYLGFIKGVVDSKDLKLNISREFLQEDRAIAAIKNTIETKVLKELKKLQEEDTEKYKKFFTNFGLSLKFGAYNNFGMDKDKLKDLLMFYASSEADLIALRDYDKDAKGIYYVAGENFKQALSHPKAQKMIDEGKNILVLTDPVDEFVIKVLGSYDDKPFINVASSKNEDESEEIKQANEKASSLLEKMQNYIKEDVSEVKFSSSLGDFPVALSSKGELSIEMEKVLSQMPGAGSAISDKVLLINKDHPIAKKLEKAKDDELKDITKALYAGAAFQEGLPVDDIADINNIIFKYMAK